MVRRVERNRRAWFPKPASLPYLQDWRLKTEDLFLEIDLRADSGVARRHDGGRRQPRATRYEPEVVVRDRVGVQQVEDVDANLRPRRPEADDLRDPQVDVVAPRAPQRCRRNQVHLVESPGEGPTDLRNYLGLLNSRG